MEVHHAFPAALRDKSTEYGYLVLLCGDTCHRNGKKSAHGCRETANAIKRHFQRLYMMDYHASVEDFRREFYKNYLEEDEYEDEKETFMNKIVLTGRLATDPTFFETKNGDKGATFRIAVKDGKDTDFFTVTTYRDADFIEKYFYKGKAIEVDGKLKQNSYKSNGVNEEKPFIIAKEIHFGDSGFKEGSRTYSDPQQVDAQPNAGDQQFEENDEEMPF